MMDDKQQIFAFADDIDRLVERYRSEFDISYASVVGVLFMKAQLLCGEAGEMDADEGGEQ
jgi:hypothetical protein